jgi:hypothetical protein
MSHPGMRYSNGGSFTMMKTSAKSSAPEISNETARSPGEFGQRWRAFRKPGGAQFRDRINCRRHLIFSCLNTLDRKPVQLGRCYSNDLCGATCSSKPRYVSSLAKDRFQRA